MDYHNIIARKSGRLASISENILIWQIAEFDLAMPLGACACAFEIALLISRGSGLLLEYCFHCSSKLRTRASFFKKVFGLQSLARDYPALKEKLKMSLKDW